MTKACARWMADSAAWAHGLISALAIDGWIVRPFSGTKPTNLLVNKITRGDLLHEHPWMGELAEQVEHKLELPRSLLNSCFSLLRPAEPTPPPFLVQNGNILDCNATHNEWCRAFGAQCEWPNPWDSEFDLQCKSRVCSSVGRAWIHRGS